MTANVPGGGETPPPSPQAEETVLARIAPIPFAILALGAIFILYQLVGGIITFLLFRTTVTEEDVALIRWVTLGGQIVFILLPTILLARWRGMRGRQFFRFRMPRMMEILLVVIGVLALQQVLQGYMALQDAIPLPGPVREFVDQFKKLLEETYRLLISARSIPELLFVVLVVALTPAVCEEMLFRGLVQQSFAETAGGWKGAVLAGLIFGAYHVNPFSFLPLVALGVYFGFIVWRSGNLLLAMIAHFFNNLVATVALYLEIKDDFIAVDPTGSPGGTMLLLNTFVFGLVFISATSYFVRSAKPECDPVA